VGEWPEGKYHRTRNSGTEAAMKHIELTTEEYALLVAELTMRLRQFDNTIGWLSEHPEEEDALGLLESYRRSHADVWRLLEKLKNA
jgi:putative AlgH/UPF0301 family transcriptional regulator